MVGANFIYEPLLLPALKHAGGRLELSISVHTNIEHVYRKI